MDEGFIPTTSCFESAGITPQKAEDAENAVFILRDHFHIDASGHQPRDVRNVDLAGFEMVIAIGSDAADVVEALGIPKSKLIVWSIPGPWGGDFTEYADAALAIRKHLARLR